MNEREYLLTCLAEEAAEVAQAASKVIRFGPDERNNKPRTAAEHLAYEISEMIEVAKMLVERGIIPPFLDCPEKRTRVLHFMDYSRERGLLC